MKSKGDAKESGGRSAFRNSEGLVLVMFSRNVGNLDYNEAEVLAILEDLQIFVIF